MSIFFLLLIHIFFLLVSSYYVEYDYIAKSADELTVRKGDIITNAKPAEDGWLRGECRGVFGFVTTTFSFPHVFFLSLSRLDISPKILSR